MCNRQKIEEKNRFRFRSNIKEPLAYQMSVSAKSSNEFDYSR